MNFNKFYTLAKENGIEKSQLSYNKTSALAISIFRGEISSYQVSSSSSLSARGIFNGKCGSGRTENISSKSFDLLIDEIKSSASVLETKEEPILFEEDVKYHKKNVYSKELEAWDVNDILEKLFALESKLRNSDPRVKEVEISFEKDSSENTFTSSKGLKLNEKSNMYVVFAQLIMEENGVTKDGGEYVLSSDPKDLDIDDLCSKVLDQVVSKFDEKPFEDGTYKAVLSPLVVGSLLDTLLNALSSEEVQKHSSVLEGKLNEQVFSKKLTVKELPLTKNVFFSYFDSEGVPTQNKTLIDKGVVKTYLYNLTTAKKDGVSSTGNGTRRGSKVGVGYSNVFVKPGNLSLDELFGKVKNGIYVTQVQGLHAGLNHVNGDFSLQAEGYLIKDGVRSNALPLFTVSGNVFDLFADITDVANDSKLLPSSTTTPSVAIKKLKISLS